MNLDKITYNISPKTTDPWYRQFWPWFLIVLPLTAVIASLTTVVIATQNPHKMVAENYYKRGLSINRDLRSENLGTALGLSAQLTVDRNNGIVICSLNSKAHGSQNSEVNLSHQLVLSLHHPTDNQHDQRVILQRQNNGKYYGQMANPYNHHWYVSLTPDIENQNSENLSATRWLLRGILPRHTDDNPPSLIQFQLGDSANRAANNAVTRDISPRNTLTRDSAPAPTITNATEILP